MGCFHFSRLPRHAGLGCVALSVVSGSIDLVEKASTETKGIEMSELTIKQNQETAFAFVRKLVGGDLKAYFESEQTIAFVWVECANNSEIQRLTTNYVWGSFERAKHNTEALESKLREVFGLPELVNA